MKILLTIDPENYQTKRGDQGCTSCPLRSLEKCGDVFARLFGDDCYNISVERNEYDKYEEIP